MSEEPPTTNNETSANGDTPLLPAEKVNELRLRQENELQPQDGFGNFRDANLPAIMYEAGPEIARARADRHFAKGSYSASELKQKSNEIATEMTEQIQEDYDVSIPSKYMGHIYGMAHDFATVALGQKIYEPPKKKKSVAPPGHVMHSKRIREYDKRWRSTPGKTEAESKTEDAA